MSFIEIAFQAEISRYEDSEFEEYAKRHCNEDPDTRGKVIEELRRLIRERGECNPRRTDDAYLLRFLRCRRSIPALAHKLMVRYEQFRRENAYLYDCDPFNLVLVRDVYAGVLPESPDHGRIILMRFGRWDVDAAAIEEVVRYALVMDEIATMQPKLQILGVTIVVDLDGLNLRQVAQLTPTVAGQIVALMGVSFPLPNHNLHIIRYNWILHSIFYLFKQFMPRAVWNRIHFHGNDLSSLHKHIDPMYLPPELGGRCRHVISTEKWLSKIDEYKDDFLVQELKEIGFNIKCKETKKSQHLNKYIIT
ncbi:clavesin-1 [Spodoptera frugiperda]|uniref:Clavesin-1 n=1 Tax=Spodoptera frugiperda TaxID=7108 RepID=A0A2H1VEG3_SPOFR|nr:clavesin-1 [Spodoptera frugiperda]